MQSNAQHWWLWRVLRVVTIGRNPRNTLVRIVVFVAVVFFVREFVLWPIRVLEPSMLPAYQPGGVNFVNHMAYLRSPPRRGDVVAIRLAGPSVMYLKRIIGLPGETVAFHEGRVLINGKVLEEPYVKYTCDWEVPPVTLGGNWYYVVGDNRTMLPEEHKFGKASRERIVGKILLCKNLFVSSSPQP
jgi:signal peptidase I